MYRRLIAAIFALTMLGPAALRAQDILSEGYAVLEAVKERRADFEALAENYVTKYPEALPVPQIQLERARVLFDREEYGRAYTVFDRIRVQDLYGSQEAEYCYKKAYCKFAAGDFVAARQLFRAAVAAAAADPVYYAPSCYSLGYIYYSDNHFREAVDWFTKSSNDWRFEAISNYYILECRFMLKDYRYVTEHASEQYEKIPEDRKGRLSRIISESYLVLGDTDRAKEYYEKNLIAGSEKTRSDYFYAGSLMYAMNDYEGAVENYSRMRDRTDSLGQVANYQMGYSYIQLRNKVAAMGAFQEASTVRWNPDIQEDAYFNFAKLSFDLNHDTSIFNDYLKKYNALQKGDQIYGYIALACLYNHDYEGAVAAYDHIETLSSDMRSNYMKAYYLRANQLIFNHSYRKAIPCLKTASYYTDKRDPFNQLCRYWMGEAYYRDDQFKEARTVFTELYNISALDRQEEGYLIPYNVAYCYFKDGDYEGAVRWFNTYLSVRRKKYGADAETRIGDCYFYMKRYEDAIAAYERKIDNYPDVNDIYPYYRAGIAKGLIGDRFGKIQILESVNEAAPSAAFYPEALYELGRAYVANGDNAEAANTFLKLRSTTDDKSYKARAMIELGMISRNGGRDDEALGYYMQVISSVPGSDSAQEALLAVESIYRSKGEPEEYLAYVESIGGAGKTDVEKEDMYFNTAEEIFLNENYDKALVTLERYHERYPGGAHAAQADFYIAECYKNLGKKEQARDYYRKAIDAGQGSFVELAMLNFAALSYSLEHYSDAYGAYSSLEEKALLDNNRYAALVGKMRSAYKEHAYQRALADADALLANKRVTWDDAIEAQYVKAKSYLATSQREQAFKILNQLSEYPYMPQGAEARYLIIQDQYDQGDFDGIEEQVYDFSESAGGQRYWLAKAFIVLGDAFVERNNIAQARATFESIRDGYTPSGTADDIMDQINLRLSRLSKFE